MYTVVSREQAPTRRRAVIASFVALGLTTVLAATFVNGRQTIRLGQRIAPAHWRISFHPPAGWSEHRRDADYYEFRDLRERRNRKQLTIWLQTNPSALGAGELATALMAEHVAPVLGVGSLAPPDEISLGPLPGARVNMPATGNYLHVGLLPPHQTAAVILWYRSHLPFGERDVRTCRRVVESVEAASGP